MLSEMNSAAVPHQQTTAAFILPGECCGHPFQAEVLLDIAAFLHGDMDSRNLWVTYPLEDHFSILSTTLFNVKINDIVKQVDPGVECSLCVDDFVIMYKSTIDAIQWKLQHTINRFEKWTLKNGFTISKNWTIAMHFCPGKNAWVLF